MPQDLTRLFILACVAAIAAIAGYFIKRWIESVDALRLAIDGLNKTLVASLTTQAVHAEKLVQHREELDELWNRTCQAPDCPNRKDVLLRNKS